MLVLFVYILNLKIIPHVFQKLLYYLFYYSIFLKVLVFLLLLLMNFKK